MLTPSVARRRLVETEQERGFTLIELMVVVMIIAILIAIAIPTFLGTRERAYDRAAQSSLRLALTAAKTSFTDVNDFSQANRATLQAIEQSVTFTDTGPSTGFKSVSIVATPGGQTWWATVLSKSGRCFGIEDNVTAGGPGTTFAGSATVLSGTCRAPASDPSWADPGW